jgi:hypothetical protein
MVFLVRKSSLTIRAGGSLEEVRIHLTSTPFPNLQPQNRGRWIPAVPRKATSGLYAAAW